MKSQSELVSFLENKWREACRQIANNDAVQTEIFALLVEFYSEPHRTYHNLNHIKALLVLSAEFENRIEDFAAVGMAIWFHDAIYQPQKNDNEERSAELAVENLRKLEAAESQIENVRQTILATKTHSAERLTDDGKLFLDFDLSVLGAKSETYQRYAAAIRQEYSFVPETLYQGGRRNILENFLRRDSIYLTDECRERFEAQARTNITAEITYLSFESFEI